MKPTSYPSDKIIDGANSTVYYLKSAIWDKERGVWECIYESISPLDYLILEFC